ncbi:heterokaryon incompatibility protein-domain-containing protein [Hypoxylon sp. NC0597]|nr:heterokaryon incompatibility protein-domain-containing protein [Hypoxylon sp. NC0597]
MEDRSVQAPMEDFPYPPLPLGEEAIRLLTIEPGKFDDKIICTLNPVDLNTMPIYAALSYTWDEPYPDRVKLPTEMSNPEGPTGESTGLCRQSSPDIQSIPELTPEDYAMDEIDGPGTIIVNSHQFSVKHNLFLALRHIRSSKSPFTIWVDAICINQNNTEERNIHVTLMSFIYKRAGMVVAWLGPRDYEKDYPARSDQLRMMRTAWEEGHSHRLAEYLKHPKSLHSQDVNFREASRSWYWTRLWIIQEACLASQLVFVYGSGLFTYDITKELCYRDMEYVLRYRKRRHSETMRLEWLVEAFKYFACSDARDRIYGILGLVHGVIPYARTNQDAQNEPLSNPLQHGGMLKVDYAQSLYGVWIDVVRYLSSRANGIGTSHILEVIKYRFTVLHKHLQSLNIVAASGIVQEVLGEECEQQDFMITAIGYLCGEILAVGPSNPRSCRSHQEWLYYFESRAHHSENDIEILRETNEQYMSEILNLSDRQLSRIQGFINPRVIAWSPERTGTPSSDPEYVAKYEKIWKGAGDQQAQPRFCFCTGNHIALVPSATRPGDVIVRFWNCSTAIVMRPYRTSFMLIGRAGVVRVVGKVTTPKGPVVKDTLGDGAIKAKHDAHFLDGLSGAFSPTHRLPNPSSAPGAVCVNLDMSTLQLITAPM